jgi:hypothetical protein
MKNGVNVESLMIDDLYSTVKLLGMGVLVLSFGIVFWVVVYQREIARRDKWVAEHYGLKWEREKQEYVDLKKVEKNE